MGLFDRDEVVDRERTGVSDSLFTKLGKVLRENPGAVVAGASMMSNMDGGDYIKMALAFGVAYKMYNTYQQKKDGTYRNFFQRQGDRLQAGAKVLGDVTDKAREKITEVGERVGKFAEEKRGDMLDASIDKRLQRLAEYNKQQGSIKDPELGMSRNQMTAVLDSVAPMAQTPTMQRVAADPELRREYMPYVIARGEHQMNWDKTMKKAGVDDLSKLTFYATDENGKFIEQDGQRLKIDPYADGQKFDRSTPQGAAEYATWKAETDRAVRYGMDHGAMAGVTEDGRTVKPPHDAYSKDLASMDAASVKFAKLEADMKTEQMSTYLGADENLKRSMVPTEIAATMGADKYLDASQVALGMQWQNSVNRATQAENGIEVDRVEVAKMMQRAEYVDVPGRAKETETVIEVDDHGPEAPGRDLKQAPGHEAAESQPARTGSFFNKLFRDREVPEAPPEPAHSSGEQRVEASAEDGVHKETPTERVMRLVEQGRSEVKGDPVAEALARSQNVPGTPEGKAVVDKSAELQ